MVFRASGQRFVMLAGWAGLLLPAGVAGAGESSVAVVADRWVAPDGSIRPDGAVLVTDGKISRVGPADELPDAKRVAYPSGSVVSPGLIDLLSSLGVHGQNIERVRSIDDAPTMYDAIDTQHRDFRAAVRAGVTAALICPLPNNVVGGAGSAVRIGGPGRIETLHDAGPLMFALGSTVLQWDQAPTSRVGALQLLRGALERAGAGNGGSRLAAFTAGRVGGIVVCDDDQDVSAALRTFPEYGPMPVLAHTTHAVEVAEEIASRKQVKVVIGPYGFDHSPRTLAGAGALDRAGVEIAFAGGLPAAPAESLRITAALAVRYGLARPAARRALTVHAAAVLGAGDRIGRISPGMDGDLVVFSGDPLRLDSRVLAVYVKGVRVHDGSINDDN